MKQFEVIRTYAHDDLKFYGDAYNVELIDEEGKTIVSGDYYHDKIDERIEGFFLALDFLKINYECNYTNRNCKEGEY